MSICQSVQQHDETENNGLKQSKQRRNSARLHTGINRRVLYNEAYLYTPIVNQFTHRASGPVKHDKRNSYINLQQKISPVPLFYLTLTSWPHVSSLSQIKSSAIQFWKVETNFVSIDLICWHQLAVLRLTKFLTVLCWSTSS